MNEMIIKRYIEDKYELYGEEHFYRGIKQFTGKLFENEKYKDDDAYEYGKMERRIWFEDDISEDERNTHYVEPLKVKIAAFIGDDKSSKEFLDLANELSIDLENKPLMEELFETVVNKICEILIKGFHNNNDRVYTDYAAYFFINALDYDEMLGIRDIPKLIQEKKDEFCNKISDLKVYFDVLELRAKIKSEMTGKKVAVEDLEEYEDLLNDLSVYLGESRLKSEEIYNKLMEIRETYFPTQSNFARLVEWNYTADFEHCSIFHPSSEDYARDGDNMISRKGADGFNFDIFNSLEEAIFKSTYIVERWHTIDFSDLTSEEVEIAKRFIARAQNKEEYQKICDAYFFLHPKTENSYDIEIGSDDEER